MRWLMSSGALAAAIVCTALGAAAIELDLTRADIEHAVKIARGTEAQRAQFHAAYQLPVADDFVEKLEVITEYRRMVLIAEQHLAAGEWAFGLSPRSAEDALRPWKRKVTLRARIRFHPQNVYPMLPQVNLTIGGDRDQLIPLRATTEPHYALGDSRAPARTVPLLGALAEADFDAVSVGQHTRDVAVHVQGGTEVHKAVDFAALK